MASRTWQEPDGTWTIASYAIRELFTATGVKPAEIYYVLHTLGIESYFADHWDNHHFFERAGLPEQAARSIDPKRDGRIALAGDYAWAAGNTAEAKRLYEESLSLGRRDSSTMAGLGGLVRLHFVTEEYGACVDAFKRGCPPHEYYLERRAITLHGDADLWMKSLTDLDKRFRRSSPYFISQAKYMCRAIVAAAAKAEHLDNTLRTMISDYFQIDATEIDELARATTCDDEIIRLRKRLAPKPIKKRRPESDLLAEGKTDRATMWCKRLPISDRYVKAASSLLDDYLEHGNPATLDDMIVTGSPLGVPEADGAILSAALESRESQIITLPDRRLMLLRRFSTLCRYPKYDFLTDYLEVVPHTQSPIEPSDVISAILDLQWHTTSYKIDHSGLGGTGVFGKAEISDHREWLEISLRDYTPVFERANWTSRDAAVTALHQAYLFMRERFNSLRQSERWISEARLGDALSALFGKEEVHRYARPLWLSPQHLDYFLPRFALAVEYMGAQHYKPIEIFGGASALAETKVRDERKRSLCARMGVALAYVTYEEDIGRRAKEIHAEFCNSRT